MFYVMLYVLLHLPPQTRRLMLYLYKHLDDASEPITEAISPAQAEALMAKHVVVKSILHAWEDDHELSLVVTCQTDDARYLTIAMAYCCAHDTEWPPLFCWALTGQHHHIHDFMTKRLHAELIRHQEMDMREI